MKIAFFGATKVGYRCCQKLVETGQEVVGIFTIPKRFNISYTKEKVVENVLYEDFHVLANKYDIPVVEVVENMASAKYVETLRRWQPDFILVIGWYYMVPKVIRDIAPLGCAGIHASLLPRYAGGSPLVWAIIEGERETGASLFYFDDGMDTGDLIAQEKIAITFKDTIATLYSRVEDVMLTMIEEFMPKIENGTAPRIRQDLTHRTVFALRKPEDGLIDWNRPCLDLYNFIRAQTLPYPGAFTFRKEQKLSIWQAKFYDFVESKGEPGRVLDIVDNEVAKGVIVATGDDIPLLVTKVGTKEINLMEAIEYARRENLQGGDILGKR